MSNRFQEVLRSTPPVTAGIVLLCCMVYVLQLILDLDLDRFTMCPRLVFYLHEYYRILTSCVFHGSFVHIAMNMVSSYHLSMLLEKRFGTIPHFVTTLGAMLTTSMFYLGISWLASTFFAYDGLLYQHSVGFSGVLFHFLVLECNLSPSNSRSLFGVVEIPTYVYPWVLLVVLQFFIPNLSFLGHFSGIATGTLQHYGLLHLITVGSDLDNCSACRWLVAIPGFVSAPTNDNNRSFQDPAALGHSVRSGARTVVNSIRHLIETFWVVIFGRGNRFNSNVRVWSNARSPSTTTQELPMLKGGHVLGSALEDDEEWGGLPTIGELEKQSLTTHVV
jgi:membrane associated rhomboid family serine protease